MSKHLDKKKSHISFMPKLLITVVVVLLALGFHYRSITVFILALTVIVYTFLNRIDISSEGVKYKRKFFKWEAINSIGIAVKKSGVPPVVINKIIYISLAEYRKPIHIVSARRYYYDNQYNRVPTNIELETAQNCIIIVSFNRRLINHIMVYWGGDIKNLNDTTGWKSYTRLYNRLYRHGNKMKG